MLGGIDQLINNFSFRFRKNQPARFEWAGSE